MKKTVCVDLDGTLLRYDGWKGVDHLGEPLPGAVEFTKALSEFADVVIWTTRCNPEMNKPESAHLLRNRVRDHLDKHGFSYVEIFIGTAKPVSSAFIDDRAVSCTPQEREGEYDRALIRAWELCLPRETWRGRPIQRLDDPNVDFPLPPEPGWEKEL